MKMKIKMKLVKSVAIYEINAYLLHRESEPVVLSSDELGHLRGGSQIRAALEADRERLDRLG